MLQTFDAPRNVDKPVRIPPPNIARSYPALGVKRLAGTVFHPQISHEDVAPAHQHLSNPRKWACRNDSAIPRNNN